MQLLIVKCYRCSHFLYSDAFGCSARMAGCGDGKWRVEKWFAAFFAGFSPLSRSTLFVYFRCEQEIRVAQLKFSPPLSCDVACVTFTG